MMRQPQLAPETGVTINISGGQSFTVQQQEDSLLRAALRAGLNFPYDCSVGGCGTCRFTLVDGEMADIWPQAPGLPERERARGKRLACQSKPLSNCTINVRMGAEPLRDAHRMHAVLRERRALCADTAEFVFVTKEPANFLPGQYALFYLPNVQGPRAYSMSNLPNDKNEWRFIVRRTPTGSGSNTLFDHVAVGASIVIDGPYGHAYFRYDSKKDILCIAGGSGLGPMLSIALAALESDKTRPVHFLLGLRSQDDLGMCDTTSAFAHGPMKVHTILSSPDATRSWAGPSGYLHEHLEQIVPKPLAQYEIYMAGPPLMISALTDILYTRAAVPPPQVHFDRFL